MQIELSQAGGTGCGYARPGLSIVDLVRRFRRVGIKKALPVRNLSIERVNVNCDRRRQRGDRASGRFHIRYHIAHDASSRA